MIIRTFHKNEFVALHIFVLEKENQNPEEITGGVDWYLQSEITQAVHQRAEKFSEPNSHRTGWSLQLLMPGYNWDHTLVSQQLAQHVEKHQSVCK